MRSRLLRREIARKAAAITLALLICTGWQVSTAQSELASLVGDRPDFTESTETVPAQMVQLETGASLARVDQGDAITLGEVLARIGLLWRWLRI